MKNLEQQIRTISSGIHSASSYLREDLEAICDDTMESYAQSTLKEVEEALESLRELDGQLKHTALFNDALMDISMHFGYHHIEFEDSKKRSLVLQGYAQEFVEKYADADWEKMDYMTLVGEFAVEKAKEHQISGQKYEISYVFGTEAVREYEEALDSGEKWNVSSLCDCGSVCTGKFDTQAELEAYKQGVEDSTGWLESRIIMTDEEWEEYLKEYHSDDDDDE